MTWPEAFTTAGIAMAVALGGVFDLPLGIKTVCGKRGVK